jgi:hypothetical protein
MNPPIVIFTRQQGKKNGKDQTKKNNREEFIFHVAVFVVPLPGRQDF